MLRLTKFLNRRWPLLYAAGWLWFLVFFILIILIPHDVDSIIYYQVWLARRAVVFLAIIPYAIFLVAAAGFFAGGGNIQAVAAMLVVPTLFGTCAIPFFSPVIFGSTQLYHLERLSAEGHVYNLAIIYEVEGSTGDYYYVLYECDRIGFRCDAIFRHDIQSRLRRPAVAIGVEDDVLWLTLDDERAFEYQLE